MAREFSFTREIVSRLGSPPEPFGLQEALVLAAFLAAAAAYFAFEAALGRLILRFFRRLGGSGD